jgi:hypothetical protein
LRKKLLPVKRREGRNPLQGIQHAPIRDDVSGLGYSPYGNRESPSLLSEKRAFRHETASKVTVDVMGVSFVFAVKTRLFSSAGLLGCLPRGNIPS